MAALAVLQSEEGNVADTSSDFILDEPAPGGAAKETDAARLAQRQKQIDYGKNTLGYVNYLKAVPRQRRRSKDGGLIPIDPITPDVRQLCSKRAFDGQVRKWRRMLHRYDPASAGADCAATLRAPALKAAEPRDLAGLPAVNPAPPAAAAPGDKRRCRAGSASAERAGSAPGCGKRARTLALNPMAAEVALAARSIYGAWDEDDVAV